LPSESFSVFCIQKYEQHTVVCLVNLILYRANFLIPVSKDPYKFSIVASSNDVTVIDYKNIKSKGMQTATEEYTEVPKGMSVAKSLIKLASGQVHDNHQVAVLGSLCRCGDTRGTAKELARLVASHLGLIPTSVSLKEPASWEFVFGPPMSAQAYLSY
jgi:hypothetical protein